MNCVFVFAYYSYKDPVFQSAVLPYLKLVNSPERRLILLTWEKGEYEMCDDERRRIQSDLFLTNIVWYRTKWHSGSPKLFKKAFDFAKGVCLSLVLIRRHKARKIYSEGFPGAVISHCISIVAGIPHVIHTFEPHADYMLEAGVWKRSSWEYKLLKKLEIPIANHAEYIITATHNYKKVLLERGARNNIAVIPSCIDTTHYRFLPEKRREIRSRLGIATDQIIIAYLGKLGGMYMKEELFRFFRACLDLDNRKFFFFLLTDENATSVDQMLNDLNIPSNSILVKYLHKDAVPAYLSAADIGFSGIRPIPSRRFSSPIKNGEYWACGLPILVPAGISDDYIHATKEDIGFTFREFRDINLEVLESLKAKDRRLIQDKCYALRGLANYKQAVMDLFKS